VVCVQEVKGGNLLQLRVLADRAGFLLYLHATGGQSAGVAVLIRKACFANGTLVTPGGDSAVWRGEGLLAVVPGGATAIAVARRL